MLIPGTAGLGGVGTDSEQMCGLPYGCHTCRTLVYPLPHRILPGLQWTCGHATWGSVTQADLEKWEAWREDAFPQAAYWLKDDIANKGITYRVPAEHLALIQG